ncbi:uncharacterized protein TNCV_531761 [Trichonephila clavipes]|nr:uncharacterized protein TNCV_531761 [Trichonephila clavipes]
MVSSLDPTIDKGFRICTKPNQILSKKEQNTSILRSLALKTINTMYPEHDWVHIYINGSLLKDSDYAGSEVKESIQLTTKKAFTSAKRIIKKKLNDLFSRQYAERNFNKIWWNNLKDIPMGPRRKAVAKFRLTTGHDCLLKHLHRIHVAQGPFCTLCDFREDMDADPIRRCPALRGSSLCTLYLQTRDLLDS